MKLATLYGRNANASMLHLAVGDSYVSVDELAQSSGHDRLRGLADVGELLALGPEALEELRSLDLGPIPAVPAADVVLAPPVRHPSKIVCIGSNYAAHIEESGGTRPERIVLFAKFPSCLVGDGVPVVLPAVTTQLDYEGELAVVIGRRAKGVSSDEALEYVGGFTIVNDISARDLQGAEPQWIRGKALDTFAPLGPVFLDAASAPPIGEMHIRTLVNGEVRQDASCSLMLTPVPELIEHISACITLEPGDIIATGTPSGVALGMNPPNYLQDGDSVSVEINAIGSLTNPITAAK